MKRKSIYKYASEAGVPAGIYLTLMSACFLLSVRMPNLPVFILPLGIGFPFILWLLLRKICKLEPVYMKFSSIWLGGIYTVIFGTLICFFLSALYVVFIEPAFVTLYFNNALQVLEASPLAEEYQSSIMLMREAMNAHILPSGLELLMTISWFTCFTGSLLSLFIALIMTKVGKKVGNEVTI